MALGEKAASFRKAFLGVQKSLSEIVCGDRVWDGVKIKLEAIAKTLLEIENEKPFPRKETFKVAVCGHFSTGKSSFINAIIGTELCPVDTEITTKARTRFLYGKPAIYETGVRRRKLSKGEYQRIVQSKVDELSDVSFEVYLENPILQKFVFIDTPGRGADDEVVGDCDDVNFNLVSTLSADDKASMAACEEADCIIYLSHPKNIHDEDEDFLQSDVACKKPVLVVMPKVDRLREDAAQLIATYQTHIDALRKINPLLSALYCCGGFGKKKAPGIKRDSIEKLMSGLDALYSATMQDQKRLYEEWNRLRMNTIRKLSDQILKLESAVSALQLSPNEIKVFDDNLKQYYSPGNGWCQWINVFVKDWNLMISHFKDRASSYCYRKEYNWCVNHAAIDDEKIRKRVCSDIAGMVETITDRLHVILVTKINDNALFSKLKECVERLGAIAYQVSADATGWWSAGCRTWPGDSWYWSNDDVDRVGKSAVKDWAETILAQCLRLFVQNPETSRCVQKIESEVSSAVERYRDLRGKRLLFLVVLNKLLIELKKEVHDAWEKRS